MKSLVEISNLLKTLVRKSPFAAAFVATVLIAAVTALAWPCTHAHHYLKIEKLEFGRQ